MDELREAFEQAWDKSEEGSAPEEEAQTVPEETEKPEETVTTEEEEEKPEEALPDEKPAPELQETATDEEKPKETKAAKAPAGWTPTNREQWANLPDSVKDQITKREQEIDLALKKTSNERRVAQQLSQTVQPYQQAMIAAGYKDPFQAIDTLMRTESGLRTGTAHEKATIVADLIKNYGVDIQSLDSLLAGQPVQSGENSALESMLEQRLAPINQYMQQIQQTQLQAQQQEQQTANKAVSEFQGEFFDDVRMDMADIMDMAAKRGVQMNLQEAYDKACMLHPEISQVVRQREADQRILEASQQTARKKAAASASLTGRQVGVPGNNPNASLRETLSEAWNDSHG